MKKIQRHHWESNPRPSGLQRSVQNAKQTKKRRSGAAEGLPTVVYRTHLITPKHYYVMHITCQTCKTLFHVLLTVHLGTVFVNNQLGAHYFSCMFISILYMFRAAIRRINCIKTTSGVCHSVQMTRLLYRVTYKRCRVDTINSPDDGHMAARNMYGIEINIHEKELCLTQVIY